MSALTALDILLKARELPWCQGAYACDAAGEPTYYGAPGAVSFCLAGACRRAAVDLGVPPSRAHEVEELLSRVLPPHPDGSAFGCIEGFNDAPNRTEAEVRAVQDRAIELARQEARTP